jgi:hypothetical protein
MWAPGDLAGVRPRCHYGRPPEFCASQLKRRHATPGARAAARVQPALQSLKIAARTAITGARCDASASCCCPSPLWRRCWWRLRPKPSATPAPARVTPAPAAGPRRACRDAMLRAARARASPARGRPPHPSPSAQPGPRPRRHPGRPRPLAKKGPHSSRLPIAKNRHCSLVSVLTQKPHANRFAKTANRCTWATGKKRPTLRASAGVCAGHRVRTWRTPCPELSARPCR